MENLRTGHVLRLHWNPFIIYMETGHQESIYPFFIDELRDKLSTAEFQRLKSKIMLISDEDNPFLALDEAGNRFDYQRQRPLERNRDNRAIDWLEINEPDYYD